MTTVCDAHVLAQASDQMRIYDTYAGAELLCQPTRRAWYAVVVSTLLVTEFFFIVPTSRLPACHHCRHRHPRPDRVSLEMASVSAAGTEVDVTVGAFLNDGAATTVFVSTRRARRRATGPQNHPTRLP